MRYILTGLFIFFLSASNAQIKNLLFYHITADQGLSSEKTTCSFQDFEGYLWFGTEEGLNRFEHYFDIVIYKSDRKDSTSLSEDYITVINEDYKNRLWIGTISGLNIYDRAHDKFHQLCNKIPSLKNKKINELYFDERTLWVGTSGSLIQIDIDQLTQIKSFDIIDTSGNPIEINTVVKSDDLFLIGTSAGIYELKDGGLKKIGSFPNLAVNILQIKGNNLYVGTYGKGIFHGKIKNQQVQDVNQVFENDERVINDILPIQNADIWVATTKGVYIYDSTLTLTNESHYEFENFFGISDHEIIDLYQDNIGSIWLTTPLGGINYYHEANNQFEFIAKKLSETNEDEPLDTHILSMYADSTSDDILIGTRGGISKFDTNKRKFEHYADDDLKSTQMLSIAKDAKENIWVGTNNGLYYLNNRAFKKAAMKIADFTISSLIFDKKSNILWIGTESNGLWKYDIETKATEKFISANPLSKKLEFIEDLIFFQEHLWLGTSDGLYELRNDSLINTNIMIKSDTVPSLWINELYINNSNELMIGTRKDGLLIYNNERQCIPIEKLSGRNIKSIISSPRPDGIPDYWIATEIGLSKLDIHNDIIKHYYLKDGIQGTQFSSGATAYLNNQIYFGGLNGLTVFNPLEVLSFELPFNITFSDLYIRDEKITTQSHPEILETSIALTKEILLPPENNSFTLVIDAIDYLRPDSVTFKYKLENYDKKWLKTDQNRISYTNLPRNKTYVLKVKAKSRYRKWSEVQTLVIKIDAFYYDKWWFRGLILVIVILLVLAGLWYRDRRNRMKQKVLERIVKSRTEELSKEIQEKKKTAEALVKAKEEAEKANRTKSEFLANISHEIRTPLNGILGLAHLISQNQPKKENMEMLHILEQSAESLRDIINDLLDLSKIEAGKFKIIPSKFNLKPLAYNIIKIFEHQAHHKQISLSLTYDDHIPEILLGDNLRIRQILVNLLSNAVKFTDEGSVHVSVNIQGFDHDNKEVSLLIKVKDTGIGIPQDKINMLFNSFTQIDNSSKRRYGGTGLGLAISKELTNLMGGSIWVTSKAGKGATFHVRLTLPFLDFNAPSIQKLDIPLPAGKKILLVEDNLVNVMVAVKMLKNMKQEVDTANNGVIALEMLKKKNYDLILLDIQMPVMDGFETAEAIRKTMPDHDNTPIIAITAGAMKEDQDKCYEVGMNDFLPKPMRAAELEEMLKKYL